MANLKPHTVWRVDYYLALLEPPREWTAYTPQKILIVADLAEEALQKARIWSEDNDNWEASEKGVQKYFRATECKQVDFTVIF